MKIKVLEIFQVVPSWLGGGGHTRQQDVEVSPIRSRISPSTQRILRTKHEMAGWWGRACHRGKAARPQRSRQQCSLQSTPRLAPRCDHQQFFQIGFWIAASERCSLSIATFGISMGTSEGDPPTQWYYDGLAAQGCLADKKPPPRRSRQ